MKVSEMTDYELLNILEAELLPKRMLDMTYDDIHRAEMALPAKLRDRYLDCLAEALGVVKHGPSDNPSITIRVAVFRLITATPRQRAEAMVRALGGGE